VLVRQKQQLVAVVVGQLLDAADVEQKHANIRADSADLVIKNNVDVCFYLFAIKGRRPLTHHISSITITKNTQAINEQVYNANYKTTFTNFTRL